MKTDNIDFSMQLLAELRDKKLPLIYISDKDFHNYFVAINDAISALKTIQDGNYNMIRRHSTYGMNRFMQFDIKTLYEQMTMYCQLVGEAKDGNKLIFEKYHQPNTPIDVNVYWENNHVIKMTFEIREGKGI